MHTPPRFARLGRIALNAVMVGTALLAIAPWAIVKVDVAILSPGDRVLHQFEGYGHVESITDGKATLKMENGSIKILPIADLTEM